MPHDTPDPKDPLQQLSAKIDAMRQESSVRESEGKHKGESQALRLVSDFSAATLVGCGIGYGFDAWLASEPWGLIIGLFLGVAAGTRRMLQHEHKGN